MRENLGLFFTTGKKVLIATHFITIEKNSNNAIMQTIRRKDFYYKKNKEKMNTSIKKVDPRMGYYIAGFTDGEGSFNVSIKKRKDYVDNWKLSVSFNISQKDRVILSLFKKILGCGTLRERKDGVVYYEVTNINSLYDTILPFFKRFQFLSANKKKNFSIFSQIVELMHNKAHLNEDGFRAILDLREKLNEGRGRKRKYTLQDVINSRRILRD